MTDRAKSSEPSGSVFLFRRIEILGSGALENVEGEFSRYGEVFWAVILSVAGAILVESHVEDPMETVFDWTDGIARGQRGRFLG